MKYLQKFENYTGDTNLYNKDWEKFLPEIITVYKAGKSYTFKKDNTLLNADWINISYKNNLYGEPNSLMFDVYYAFDDGLNTTKLDVDITYGDLMVSEFTIAAPNKIIVGEYTSYGSKFDPSNTEFALDDNTLRCLVNYFNAFDNGIKINLDDLNFLSSKENMDPTN